MKRIIWCMCLCLAWILPLFAEDPPKMELFGGYQYRHISTSNYAGGNGNANGWVGAFSGNLTSSWSLVGEVSGAYNNTIFSAYWVDPSLSTTIRNRQYSLLFGPRYSIRTAKFTFFGQALLGVEKASSYPDNKIVDLTNGINLSDVHYKAAFGSTFGGGVDYNLGKKTAIRLGQFDLYVNRGHAETGTHFRYSTGIVFRF